MSNDSQRAWALDPRHATRSFIVEADAQTLANMRKEGHSRGWTVYCDEGAAAAGDATAPAPLDYFSLALAF